MFEQTPANWNRSIDIGGDVSGSVIVTGDENVVQFLCEKPRDLTKAPYKFLSYYDIGDRDIFFGRNAVIEQLAGQIPRHKVLILNGQSGSGKTSLLNAGLIPRLAENGYLYLAFRDYSDPLQQLRDYLDEACEIADLVQMSLLRIMRAIRDQQQSPLVVLFDQFERFFVGVQRETRRAFLEQLKQCLDAELTADQLNLVFSLRREFYGQFVDEADAVIPAFEQESHRYTLRPLNRDEAGQAILGPLKEIPDISFDTSFVDDVLLPHLMRESEGEAEIQPPHLQIVCNRLYAEARSWYADEIERSGTAKIAADLYDELGQAAGMLRGYLDDVVDRIAGGDEERMGVVRSTLKLMIDTTETRKFVSMDDICGGLPDVAEDETRILIEELHEARVVEIRDNGKDRTYSLSHEIMVAKVQSWDDEREWERKRAQETLERGMTEWKNTRSLLDHGQVVLIKTWLPLDSLSANERDLLQRSEERYRTVRLIKRTAIVAVVVCLVLLPVAIWGWVASSINAGIAETKTTEANTAKIETEKNLAQSYILRGMAQIEAGNYGGGVSHFFAAYRIGPTAAHEPFRSSALDLIGGWSPELGHTCLHDADVVAVAISADGMRAITGSDDDTARLWNVETGAAIGEPLQHAGAMFAVAISADGQRAITGSDDDTARLWNVETGAAIGEPLQHAGAVFAVAISADGQRAITGSDDDTARLWNVETGAAIGEPLQHAGAVFAVAISADGQRAITGSDDDTVRLWNGETGKAIGEPLQHDGQVQAVTISADGKRAITGSHDRTARLWNVETATAIGQPLQSMISRFDPVGVRAVAISADGKRAVTGSSDHTARLWNVETGAAIGQPLQHQGSVNAVAISADGKRAITGSHDDTARLWNVETGTAIGQPLQHQGSVNAVAISADGKRAITSYDKTARLWNVETGTAIGQPLENVLLVSMFASDPVGVRAVAISADGKRAVTGSFDHTARLWNVETGAAIGQPLQHQGSVNAVAISADGKRAITGSHDDTARLWNVETGTAIGQPLQHQGRVNAVAISADGKRAITASDDDMTRLWNVETGTAIGQPFQHDGAVVAVAISADGKRAITGSHDDTARLWNVETGAAIGPPLQHQGSVNAVAISADGKRVITGSDDNTARLWNVETGAAIGPPLQHEGSVRAAAISANGDRAITASEDDMTRLWNLETGTAIGQSLQQDDDVFAVAISADGKRAITDYGNAAWLWNVETGAVIGEPLQHDGEVTAVAISADGKRAVTGSNDDTGRLWKLPQPALDEPERLRLSVEVRTTFHFDGQGNLQHLTQKQWLERKRQLKALGGPCDIVR